MALAFAVAAVALRLETNFLSILRILLGSLAGIYFSQLDYLVFSYLTDPPHPFSQGLRQLVSRGNWKGLIAYLKYHALDIEGERRILKSALFQFSLAVLGFYIVSSSQSVFGSSLVLVTQLELFYQQYGDYRRRGNLEGWFWVLKERPTRNFLRGYFLVLAVVFGYSLLIFAH